MAFVEGEPNRPKPGKPEPRSVFASLVRHLAELDRNAERAAFLSEPASALINRLNDGRHGVAIIYEDGPQQILGGYILPDGHATLLFFNNGQVFRGVKNNAPEYDQGEYEAEFHHNDRFIAAKVGTFEDDNQTLTNNVVYTTMLHLYVMGMVVTHSNDIPKQREDLKHIVERRLLFVRDKERRVEQDVDLALEVMFRALGADHTTDDPHD